MPLLLSGLRLVLRKVMGQHREHVHTVQHSCQSRIPPTGYKVMPNLNVSAILSNDAESVSGQQSSNTVTE